MDSGPGMICIQEPGLHGGGALQPTPCRTGLGDTGTVTDWWLEDRIQILTVHLLSFGYVQGFMLDVPHAASLNPHLQMRKQTQRG